MVEIEIDDETNGIRSVAEAENNRYERQRPQLDKVGGEKITSISKQIEGITNILSNLNQFVGCNTLPSQNMTIPEEEEKEERDNKKTPKRSKYSSSRPRNTSSGRNNDKSSRIINIEVANRRSPAQKQFKIRKTKFKKKSVSPLRQNIHSATFR